MINHKLDNLKAYLRELGSVAVAYSSGVDSTFLLDVAHEVLGDKAIAVTVVSDFLTSKEEVEAAEFCRERGIKHVIHRFHPLDVDIIAANTPDRCYHCKKALFTSIEQLAAQWGAHHVLDGSNIDDLGDFRPGMRALSELGIISPLRLAGLNKQEIRQLSKERDLPTWDKPAFACLASRIPYGETLTSDKLRMIEKGEAYLRDLGIIQCRVRIHDKLARIEVEPQRIAEIAARAEQINEYFKEIGFAYVSLDLGGYRTGSLNEVLSQDAKDEALAQDIK